MDSEDLPDDEDDDEEDDDYEDLEDAALIEESQTMDEAVINILDDPLALSMTLKNQYE